MAVKILRSACECGIDATARSIPALPDELCGALRFEAAEDCGEVHWHGGEVHWRSNCIHIAITLQSFCDYVAITLQVHRQCNDFHYVTLPCNSIAVTLHLHCNWVAITLQVTLQLHCDYIVITLQLLVQLRCGYCASTLQLPYNVIWDSLECAIHPGGTCGY